MVIQLTDSFKAYQEKMKFSSVTVTSGVSGGSCCKIIVPKVRMGEPSSSLDGFHVFTKEGITFYVTKNLKLNPTITFSHERMLGKDMIEIQGYEVRHYLDSF